MSSDFKIATPLTPSFTDSLSSEVYEPAEDSFLFLDALEQDLPLQIKLRAPPVLCLEVGPGSGIISAGLSSTKYFSKSIPITFALDINPAACNFTLQTANLNNCSGRIEAIIGNGLDLKNGGLSRWKFDLILCNPPYVPTPEIDQMDHQPVNLAWDGGPDGNSKFILPFLEILPELLSDEGWAYIVLSHFNKPLEIMENFVKKLGMVGELVIERKAGRESLSVWRLEKKKVD